MQATFFETPAAFRKWLEKHHDTEPELLVGFHKTGSGRKSITWPESVDCALSFGWIDGIRRRIDDESYSIRFTPRRARSKWSAVNIKRFAELDALGLIADAGRRAFEARVEARYSYDKTGAAFPPAYEKRFKANRKAWRYWSDEAPWYRRVCTHWVVSAKKEETRERRLETLIEDCANQRRIRGVTPTKARKSS